MEAEKIQRLLYKYSSGATTPDDLKEIENLIEQGVIKLEDLQGFEKLESQLFKLETPTPSLNLDDKFYQMLRREKEINEMFNWKNWLSNYSNP